LIIALLNLFRAVRLNEPTGGDNSKQVRWFEKAASKQNHLVVIGQFDSKEAVILGWRINTQSVAESLRGRYTPTINL
jgi:hypothetical protein